MDHHSYPTTDGLEAVRDFVNSLDEGQETLDSPAALESFFAEHDLGRVAAKPADLRRAIEVREALRDVMSANNGEPLNAGAVDALNRAAARAKVVAAFDDNASWRVEPASNGVDQAIGRLLAHVFHAMSDGNWSRMKACGDPDCRWAFYDGTKNHSGRWCDMASCGNRMKVRAFRARQSKKK